MDTHLLLLHLVGMPDDTAELRERLSAHLPDAVFDPHAPETSQLVLVPAEDGPRATARMGRALTATGSWGRVAMTLVDDEREPRFRSSDAFRSI